MAVCFVSVVVYQDATADYVIYVYVKTRRACVPSTGG